MDEWVKSDRIQSQSDFSMTKKMPRKETSKKRREAGKSAVAHFLEETKMKNVDRVVFGGDEMEAWYFSPIPKENISEKNGQKYVFFCDFCLRYFAHREELEFHKEICNVYYPPGSEIYRSKEKNNVVNVFEVDGELEIEYSQNLCYLSKLFLDHKTLQYDTVPFLFYILCETTSSGCRMVGYFSKEKFSELEYNLACIMTLPCNQRKGFGNFLISLSYELSKVERHIGTPERPFSDLGDATYKKYWFKRIVEYINDCDPNEIMTLSRISKAMHFKVQDVIDALKKYDAFYVNSDNSYRIEIPVKNKKIVNEINRTNQIELCDPKKLRWVPYDNEKSKQNF